MATSGSVSTTKYDGRYGKLSWSIKSQNATTTTISWECELIGGNSGWYITSECYFEITCSKGSSSASKVTVLSKDTSRKGYVGSIGSGTFTITHNSSGAAAFTIKLSLATYEHAINCTGTSSSWALPNRYTVTYNANGGTGAPSSQTKIEGTALTLSSTVPTRSNSTTTYTVTYNANEGSCSTASATATKTTTYKFNCWNTQSDGSGSTNFNPGGTYTGNSTVTFYAQWTVDSESTTSVKLPTPSRDGYTFNGWYTDPSGGTKAGNAGASYTPTKTITLYAQWTASATYTLTYNSNGTGVSNMPANQTKLHGTNLTISTTIPARTGYTFSHWNTAADNSGYHKHPTKT